MSLPTIKIRDDTYKELKQVAGELKLLLKRPVSMDEVLERLLSLPKLKPIDFQGSWKMKDKEAEQLFTSLGHHWSRWKYPGSEAGLKRFQKRAKRSYFGAAEGTGPFSLDDEMKAHD